MGKKKNSKKNSEIKKEILKDEEKWYGLEKKFWTVVEFGVYLILFTFTCIAIGSQYQYLKSSKEAPIIDTDSKNLIVDDLYSSFSYKVDNICIDTLCDAELTAVYKGDDIKVHYSNQEDNTILTIGNVTVKPSNRLKEFALLRNGYVATIEYLNDKTSKIVYYDNNGNEVKSYLTNLNTSGNLDSMNGIYSTCDIPTYSRGSDHTINIYQYTITDEGKFVEEKIGTYNRSYCGD